MTNREQEFTEYSNLGFSELVKIKFKSAPRNATDYYYNPKNKIVYSYYFGLDSGLWESNIKIDSNNIKSPSELSTYTEEPKLKKSLSLQTKS